jgi:DNA-binding transcriptional ArsR family regulator
MASRRRQIKLTDPRMIRALSHPARISVVEELFSGRVATSTELAALTGLTPSAMSYHLRALEKYGIVEREAPTEDARERPWRAAGKGITVESTPTRAQQAATGLLLGQVFGTLREALESYARAEHRQPEEWRGKANFDTSVLYLTADETRDLSAALAKALEPYTKKSRRRRKNTRRIRAAFLTVPELD